MCTQGSILGSQQLGHLGEEVGFGKPRAGTSRPPASDQSQMISFLMLMISFSMGSLSKHGLEETFCCECQHIKIGIINSLFTSKKDEKCFLS